MHRQVEIVLGCASLLMMAATIVAVPWLVVRLPADYFVRPRPQRSLFVHALRNVAGVLLVLLGIAMLVLPGQGLVTLVLGLTLIDVPLKHRVVRRILAQKNVHAAIDKLRTRAGQPPLVVPT